MRKVSTYRQPYGFWGSLAPLGNSVVSQNEAKGLTATNITMKIYHVYIITNTWHTVLSTGMTGRGATRIQEHRDRIIPSFFARYHLWKVVYAQEFASPGEAAAAEKKIKGWTRKKKITLIESINPEWKDLLLEDSSRGSAA